MHHPSNAKEYLITNNPLEHTENLAKAREILGKLANELSDEELKTIVTEIQFLTDSWLDEFEKSIFEGKTLNKLLIEEVNL